MTQVLSKSVADAIILKIKSGEYKENDKLPNEQELSQLMGVSRITVREAIKILVSKNIVHVERGKGTFVNSRPGLLEDPFGFEFLPHDKVIRDLIELRFYLEPSVARLAAKHATKSQMNVMQEILDNMLDTAKFGRTPENHAEAYKRFCNYELLFHGYLYEMSCNAVLISLKPAIMKSVHNYYHETTSEPDYDLDLAYEKHLMIFKAIQNHDGDEAHFRTTDHYVASRSLNKFFEE